jgi:hypothetical protein
MAKTTQAGDPNRWTRPRGPEPRHMTRLVERLACLIIRLIIQTILLDRSGSVWIDEAPNLSRSEPSGPDQIDAEHQPTDLAVGGSNPFRRAKRAGQRLSSKRSFERLSGSVSP